MTFSTGGLYENQRRWIKILSRCIGKCCCLILSFGREDLVGAYNLGNASILVTEAIAIRNASWTTIQASFTHFIVDGDDKVIIQGINKEIHVLSQIHSIVQDIHYLIGKA